MKEEPPPSGNSSIACLFVCLFIRLGTVAPWVTGTRRDSFVKCRERLAIHELQSPPLPATKLRG